MASPVPLAHIERHEKVTWRYNIIHAVGSYHLWRIIIDVAGLDLGQAGRPFTHLAAFRMDFILLSAHSRGRLSDLWDFCI